MKPPIPDPSEVRRPAPIPRYWQLMLRRESILDKSNKWQELKLKKRDCLIMKKSISTWAYQMHPTERRRIERPNKTSVSVYRCLHGLAIIAIALAQFGCGPTSDEEGPGAGNSSSPPDVTHTPLPQLNMPNIRRTPSPARSPRPRPTVAMDQSLRNVEDQARKDVKKAQGSISYEFPQQMKVGQILEGSASISRSLMSEHPSRTGNSNVKTEPLQRTAEVMKLIAVPVDPTALKIESMSEANQPILKEGVTRWDFRIQALRAGHWDIVIHALVPITHRGKTTNLDVPVSTKTIMVNINPVYTIQQWDWKWVFSTILGGSAGLWAGLKWLAERKTARQKMGETRSFTLNADGTRKTDRD